MARLGLPSRAIRLLAGTGVDSCNHPEPGACALTANTGRTGDFPDGVGR
jgi:hypothetical protein